MLVESVKFHASCLTNRRSAASNSADRTRPCPKSMPPEGNQGQLNQAVADPLQRLVRHPIAVPPP
jgi:hypothetical protein